MTTEIVLYVDDLGLDKHGRRQLMVKPPLTDGMVDEIISKLSEIYSVEIIRTRRMATMELPTITGSPVRHHQCHCTLEQEEY